MRRITKKIFMMVVALLLVFAFTACGKEEERGVSGEQETSGDENKKISTKAPTDDGKDEENKSSVSTDGTMSKVDMQKKIDSLLSGIGATGFPIPDADTYKFSEEMDGFFTGSFTLTGVRVTYDDYMNQILSTCQNMKKGKLTLMGTEVGVPAGMKTIGFTVMLDEGELTLLMTHYEKDYSKEFLTAMEAKKPVIIPGTNALEKMPENFTAQFKSYGDDVTLVKAGENWYVDTIYTDDNGKFESRMKKAIIVQPDGSMLQYKAWTNDESKEMTWEKPTDFANEDLDSLLETYFDVEGSNVGFSSYMQMCKDFEEGINAFGAYQGGSLSSSLEKTGTETIGDVACDVLYSEGLWSYAEITMDPATGVMYRYKKADQKGEDDKPIWEIKWDVTEFKKSADQKLFP